MASRSRTFGMTFWVAVTLVVIGGYIVGKDAALRDNARDQVSRSTTE
ncbi:hypothetical protein [Brevundimonas subvibrioides]|nr:hypothetical protein [Brevundimonas subvibrioides]